MYAIQARPIFWSVLIPLLFLIPGLAFLASKEEGDTVHSSTLDAFGRLPLAFMENRGQLDERAAFSSRQGGLEAFFTKDGIVLQLVSKKPTRREEEKIGGANVFMTFEGASPDVKIEGCDPLPGHYNYFRGNDPSKWHTEVPAYGSIRYRGLYQGVDMVVRDHEGRLEYDLILEPGADVDAVAVCCEGNESLRVGGEGVLILETAAGTLEQTRPFTYAVDRSGAREPVACAYRLIDENRFGFHVPDRDDERALIIDPGLMYGTFLGGADNDYGWAAAVDGTGAVVVTGSTVSSDFPTTPGAYDTSFNGGEVDAFVAKLRIALSADTCTLSEPAGGAVNFTLSAGTASAQRNYLLLGSMSGTEPGTSLPGGGTILHLNWDAFTNVVISLVNTFYFQNFMGTLDPQGLGTATFNLPPGSGLPAGFTFHFAYVLQGPPWDFASNTVEITMVP